MCMLLGSQDFGLRELSLRGFGREMRAGRFGIEALSWLRSCQRALGRCLAQSWTLQVKVPRVEITITGVECSLGLGARG
jgi:hypothetical protein